MIELIIIISNERLYSKYKLLLLLLFSGFFLIVLSKRCEDMRRVICSNR